MNADEISQTVRDAAYEIISQWDNLKLDNGKTLHEHLIEKSQTGDKCIYPKDVLFCDYVINIAKTHMGEHHFDNHGWAVASAVYNVAGGYDIDGGKKVQ